MASALFLVLSLLLVGYLMRRSGRMPDNAADVLNRFVVDICVPAMILRLVPQLTLDLSLIVLVVTPWLIAGLAYALARLAARPLSLDRASTTALFLATALSNTSFLGFPLCSALLGESAVALAVVYDQLGSFLLLSTVAPLALSRVSPSASTSLSDRVRRVLLFPPLLALIVATLPLPQPEWLTAVLSAAAAALVPLAMVAVGLKLKLTPPRPVRVFVLGLVLKLAVLPCAAWLLAKALSAPQQVLEVAVLETAMPTMITAGALMMTYGVASELAAAFVSWGLLLSLITVPCWAWLVR